MAKNNLHGSTFQLHRSVFAIMVLCGSNINDTQRIRILSAADAGLTILTADKDGKIVT